MIDLFRIAIPFSSDFVMADLSKEGVASGFVDLNECNVRGAKLEAGEVVFTDGGYEVGSLRHPFESLPSSWSTLSFKIHAGGLTYWPFIEIKASPAKLLQGHNVYGSDNVELCIEALVTTFNMGMPKLAEMLDFASSEIKQMDCTFTAHLSSESEARNVISVLKNLSSGQTRSSKSSHDTTAYWGVKSSNDGKSSSRRKQLKAYLKQFELEFQIKEVQKKLKQTNEQVYQRQLDVMQSLEVTVFAHNALRFEASILPKMFKSLGVPLRVSDFVNHLQKMSSRCCPVHYLWERAWSDIFKTFEGKQVNIYDDDEVLKLLKANYFKITKSGKTSYSKANRLFRFFRSLKNEGWDEVKDTTPKATFYDSVKEISSIIPKAYLQTLKGSASNNVVPLVRFIDIDFSNQHPKNWQEPKPLHQQLRENMRLVC